MAHVYLPVTAIYFGSEAQFDDNKDYMMLPNQSLAVCDKTAGNLEKLGRDDIFIFESIYFYDGGGCC